MLADWKRSPEGSLNPVTALKLCFTCDVGLNDLNTCYKCVIRYNCQGYTSTGRKMHTQNVVNCAYSLKKKSRRFSKSFDTAETVLIIIIMYLKINELFYLRCY